LPVTNRDHFSTSLAEYLSNRIVRSERAPMASQFLTKDVFMEPSEQRRVLLQRHLEPAEHAHERCVAEGMERPVIFVLDLDDREGRKLAGALYAKDQHVDEAEGIRRVDAKATEIRARGPVIPALVMAIGMEGAAAICRQMTGNGEQTIRKIPIDRIAVVVVSAGGNSYAAIPRHRS
jgi:hypothetical protein